MRESHTPWDSLPPAHVLGEGILVNGVDAGTARRAALRAMNTAQQTEEARHGAQKGHNRAQEERRARRPQMPAKPLRSHRERPSVHPAGLARLLKALGDRR